MADRIVMGYWDCLFCGSTGIEGTTYDCPNCGHQRGKDEQVYLSKNKITYKPGQRVEDAKYLDNYKYKGVDWYCEYCGALNSAGLDHCENCNSPRTKSSKKYFDFHKDEVKSNLKDNSLDKWQCTNCGTLNEYRLENCKSCGLPRIKEENKDSKPAKDTDFKANDSVNETGIQNVANNIKNTIKEMWSSSIAKNIVISIIVATFVGLIIFLLWPRPHTLNVKDVSWEYTIDVESLETVNEDDWSLPPGGRLHYTNQEIRSYRQVLDHYETRTRTYTVEVPSGGHTEYSYSSNGDGTFTEHSHYVQDYTTETRTETYEDPVYRSEPVYATKYYYEIDKWLHKRYVKTSGSGHEPYFGDPELKVKERVGSKTKEYFVTAIDVNDKKQKIVLYTVNEDMWKEINPDTEIKVNTTLKHITSFAE